MTRPLVSISSDSHIEGAARTMASNRVRHLMVTSPRDGQVIGIITVTDLARYLKQNLTDEEIIASEVWQLFF
jgi:signal-transduction protein with cAMP-binding, CBS, and nucleotidyltransferase domain